MIKGIIKNKKMANLKQSVVVFFGRGPIIKIGFAILVVFFFVALHL